MRAYSDAVAQAVEAAGTRRVKLCSLLTLEVGFASIGTVEDTLRGLVLPSGAAVLVEGIEWGECAKVTVAIPATSRDEFDSALSALSTGSLKATVSGQRWVDCPA